MEMTYTVCSLCTVQKPSPPPIPSMLPHGYRDRFLLISARSFSGFQDKFLTWQDLNEVFTIICVR